MKRALHSLSLLLAVAWAFDAAAADSMVITVSVHLEGLNPVAENIVPLTESPSNSDILVFSVQFSEPVQNFDNEFDLLITETETVSHTGASIAGGPQEYTVDLTGVDGDGTVALSIRTDSDVKDLNGNTLEVSADSTPITVDNTPPLVDAVIFSSEKVTLIEADVFFTEDVTGVDISDFGLSVTEDIQGASVIGVAGFGDQYTVMIDSGGAFAGTIGIDVHDDDSIVDAAGNSLGGPFEGDGDFTSTTVFNAVEALPLSLWPLVIAFLASLMLVTRAIRLSR